MKVVRLVLIMVVVLSAAMSVNAQKKNEKTSFLMPTCIANLAKQK